MKGLEIKSKTSLIFCCTDSTLTNNSYQNQLYVLGSLKDSESVDV